MIIIKTIFIILLFLWIFFFFIYLPYKKKQAMEKYNLNEEEWKNLEHELEDRHYG